MSDPTPTSPSNSQPNSHTKLGREELRSLAAGEWRWHGPIAILRVDDGIRLKVAWGKAALFLFVASVVLWLGAAGAAYCFVKYRRGFSDVRFGHMLFYPWKQEEFRTARGDFLIQQAKELLKESKYREAGNMLRMGAGMSPGNRDGRTLLSQFYVVWQRPDLAEKLLLEGVGIHKDDPEYLRPLFSFLLQRQADQVVEELSDRLLKANAGADGDRDRVRLIATARATAQFFRGNYDGAEDTLRTYRLGDTSDGQLLAIRIEWERGERETALIRLQIMSEELPENEQVYGQHAAYLRELGRFDELRRLCLLRQIAYPERSRPRVDLLYLYDRDRNEANVQSGVEELFNDFSGNGEVLLALADFAANTGRPELARRIYDHCKANNLPWDGPALMTVEACVVAKQFHRSLDVCREMIKENPEWGKRFSFVFNGLQAIANYGLGDVEAAQLFLDNFLAQPGMRADNLVAVSNRFMGVGAKDQARQVLAQAVRADPLNQAALVGLIRLDLEIGQPDTLTASLRTLLSMRKPPRDLLRNAYDKLASDRFVFLPGRAALLEELLRAIERQVAAGAH